MKNFNGYFLIISLVFMVSLMGGCTSSNASAESGQLPVGVANTPTEAYRMLFSAVKSKDSEKIRAMLSEATIKFAEANSSGQGRSFGEVVKNGFLESTMGEKMPAIRDEQILDGFASIEVYSERGKRWELAPFVMENGGWRLAVGDVFAGSWKEPGKPRSVIEREGGNNMMPGSPNIPTVDFNSAKIIKIDPKAGTIQKGPNPTLNTNVKPVKIPTH